MTNTVNIARADHQQDSFLPASAVPVERLERDPTIAIRTEETALTYTQAVRTLDQTDRAARLLERAFVSMVEQEELCMPALERLYTALRETEEAAIEVHSAVPSCRSRESTSLTQEATC